MKIFQVLDALDYGDGVSNDVINKKKILDKMNIHNDIYAKWIHEKVKNYAHDISNLNPKFDDIIIYHYYGYSHISSIILEYPGTKILQYHNITPPDLLDTEDAIAMSQKGLNQLKHIIDRFDYFIGDSSFNCSDLKKYGVDSSKIDSIPICMNIEALSNAKYNTEIFNRFNKINLVLYVGRIAPNKKIEDIIDIFEHYYTRINNKAILLLVGNNQFSSIYFNKLKEKISHLNSLNNIIFTGKVAEQDLYAYYRSAKLFICMSEHEGFCLPVIEAMNFSIPVMAFNAGALPDTLGNTGILVYEKDFDYLAEVMNILLSSESIRQEIIEKQKQRIMDFSEESMIKRYRMLIDKWRKTQ